MREKDCEVKRDHPYLGINKFGHIILFYSKNNGTSIYHPEQPNTFGEQYCCNEENFTLYNGEVVLSND